MRKSLRIAVLQVDNQKSHSEISTLEPEADPTPWLQSHSVSRYFLPAQNLSQQLNFITSQGFDVYLNLCDGAAGEDRPGVGVVRYLQKKNLAFTGADADFYEPTRNEMQAACERSGIRFPVNRTVQTTVDISSSDFHYPAIVKHPNSYNSVGLSPASVVYNRADAEIQISKMIERYGSARIEEYISGREFTVLVAENPDGSGIPLVFNPIEVIFPSGEHFKHFSLKWNEHASMKGISVVDIALANALHRISGNLFRAMHGSGYARCDIRMNKEGELFILEINPNCSIYFPVEDSSSADDILHLEQNGHQRFTDSILHSAFLRRNVKMK